MIVHANEIATYSLIKYTIDEKPSTFFFLNKKERKIIVYHYGEERDGTKQARRIYHQDKRIMFPMHRRIGYDMYSIILNEDYIIIGEVMAQSESLAEIKEIIEEHTKRWKHDLH